MSVEFPLRFTLSVTVERDACVAEFSDEEKKEYFSDEA